MAVATGMLLALVVGLSLTVPSGAFAITRNEVLARAQGWVDNPVPYSQTKYSAGYRTDCSGFASMVWKLSRSYTTRDMHLVATKILVADLKPGDSMLHVNAGNQNHIRIFYGWVDPKHTGKDDPLARYVAYEQTGPTTWSSTKSLKSDVDSGYRAYRYKKIVDSPGSANLLLNGSFDVWDWQNKSGPLRQLPVWWLVGGDQPGPRVVHRRDVRKSGRSSIALVNPSIDARRSAALSQSAALSAGSTYTLSVWARTNGTPAGLELRLQCLDASGTVLSQKTTRGDAWSLEAVALRPMTMTVVTPARTVVANISLRLAGETIATGTAGVVAVLDDFSLVRAVPGPATLSKPYGPSSIDDDHAFSTYGHLSPRHTAGTAAVTMQCYRYQSGAWVLRKTVPAKVTDYSVDQSRYAVSMSLPLTGSWRIRAYHADSGHKASYSAYRNITVR